MKNIKPMRIISWVFNEDRNQKESKKELKKENGYRYNKILIRRDMRGRLQIFIKGMAMGAADIVPGISGGTVALLLGIYTRLVDGIEGIFSLAKKENLIRCKEGKWSEVVSECKKIDWELFIPLFTGIGASIIVLAHVIQWALEAFPAPMYAMFAGLIVSSAAIIFKKIQSVSMEVITWVLGGCFIGLLITGIQSLGIGDSPLAIFIAGAIAICAMILPGISGSALLVVMGQYENVVGAIKSFDIVTMAIFGAGAIMGMGLFSKLLKYLLHQKRLQTFAFLVGLILGSLRLQYFAISETDPSAGASAALLLLFIVAGSAVYFFEQRKGSKER